MRMVFYFKIYKISTIPPLITGTDNDNNDSNNIVECCMHFCCLTKQMYN